MSKSSALRSGGTSTAWRLRTSSGTTSSTRSCVAASTTGAATPAIWARSQFGAVTHHLSPGFNPGNRYWGAGVTRSLPMLFWWSRNSRVTTAHMVWLPRSSGAVRHDPSRNHPVSGLVLHSSSSLPRTFLSICERKGISGVGSVTEPAAIDLQHRPSAPGPIVPEYA
jgi:hypothetical protein